MKYRAIALISLSGLLVLGGCDRKSPDPKTTDSTVLDPKASNERTEPAPGSRPAETGTPQTNDITGVRGSASTESSPGSSTGSSGSTSPGTGGSTTGSTGTTGSSGTTSSSSGAAGAGTGTAGGNTVGSSSTGSSGTNSFVTDGTGSRAGTGNTTSGQQGNTTTDKRAGTRAPDSSGNTAGTGTKQNRPLSRLNQLDRSVPTTVHDSPYASGAPMQRAGFYLVASNAGLPVRADEEPQRSSTDVPDVTRPETATPPGTRHTTGDRSDTSRTGADTPRTDSDGRDLGNRMRSGGLRDFQQEPTEPVTTTPQIDNPTPVDPAPTSPPLDNTVSGEPTDSVLGPGGGSIFGNTGIGKNRPRVDNTRGAYLHLAADTTNTKTPNPAAPGTTPPRSGTASGTTGSPGTADPQVGKSDGSALPQPGTSATGDARGNAAGTSTTPGPLTPKDQTFLIKAAQAGFTEIEASRMAQQRAKASTIRSFADRMVRDHTGIKVDLEQVLKKKGMPLPKEAAGAHQKDLDQLVGLKGEAFDKVYAERIGVAAHHEAVNMFQQAAANSDDPDVRAFAGRTLAVLNQHMQLAHLLPKGGREVQPAAK